MNITLSMPTQYTERLKQESKETGLNYSEIVRRALDLYFRENSKVREV